MWRAASGDSIAADERASSMQQTRLARCALLATLALAGSPCFPVGVRGDSPRLVGARHAIPAVGATGGNWRIESAFGELTFFEPVTLTCVPGRADTFLVLERHGVLQEVTLGGVSAGKRPVLDLSADVLRTPVGDDGAVGLTLHPQFSDATAAHQGELFVFYSTQVEGARCVRLSRFVWHPGDGQVDRGSERVLIEQRDAHQFHNGGALVFGPDGFLYVSVGDEGGRNDQFDNSQRIDRNLVSGVLRIDVDCQGSPVSHPIRVQPADGRTDGYFIPSDNPFVGHEGALEEFWAIGLRMPHRMAFDPQTRWLWVGEVGQHDREEIEIVERGTNHQWSYREGTLPFVSSRFRGRRPEPVLGREKPPFFEYPHFNGDNCLIGGFVYRGERFPQLRGRYLCGDNGSGRIWSFGWNEEGVVDRTELARVSYVAKSGLASFADDPQGNVYLCVVGNAQWDPGRVFRLEPPVGVDRSAPLPERLSQTGLFADLATLAPSPGVVPYEVNAPFWSDGALKQRWIALPGGEPHLHSTAAANADGSNASGDGSPRSASADTNGRSMAPATETSSGGHIVFDRRGPWTFPVGTVFIKHFELAADPSRGTPARRLETRLLVREPGDGVYGVTYRWNEDQTDALLLTDPLDELVEHYERGRRTRQTWHYPSRAECLVCHNRSAGFVLGVNTRQINRAGPSLVAGQETNQLANWVQAGFFANPDEVSDPRSQPRLIDPGDDRFSLAERARAYLDANCASCHRPGGVARADFDARFDNIGLLHELETADVQHPLGEDEPRLLRRGDPARSILLLRMTSIDPRVQMPPLARHRIDAAATLLLRDWISELGD